MYGENSRGKPHVADNMRLADADTKRLGRVDAGIHAGDEDELVGRGGGEAVVLEVARVALRGRCDVLPESGHGAGRRIEKLGGDGRGA